MPKRGYHHGNLRQALIDAALQLIEEKGPTGFTLSEAAKQAGVTPAAVYRHYEGREDLIEQFSIPLDEYPTRCVEQIAAWEEQFKALQEAERIEHTPSNEYAATIMDSIVAGSPAVIYGNVANRGLIPQLPEGCAVEVPTLVDANGLQPTVVDDIPKHLLALMKTNVNVQELTVEALLTQNPEQQ